MSARGAARGAEETRGTGRARIGRSEWARRFGRGAGLFASGLGLGAATTLLLPASLPSTRQLASAAGTARAILTSDSGNRYAGLAEQPILHVGVTLLAFLFAVRLARWSGNNPFLNPTLIAILAVVALINAIGVPYGLYLRGTSFIHFLLAPAVVLLAVPLYRQTALIRASGGLIAAALLVGLPTGILSAVGIAWALGASPVTLLSIAPKSVTTGVAIGISEAIGGVPALTAVLVISTGIVGAIAGPAMQRWLRVEDDRVMGLAIGIAGHGIGTARALEISEVAGAFAGLGMSLNGVSTGMLLPLAAGLL